MNMIFFKKKKGGGRSSCYKVWYKNVSLGSLLKWCSLSLLKEGGPSYPGDLNALQGVLTKSESH